MIVIMFGDKIIMGGGIMHLTIRGHHLTLTEAIEEKIKSQFEKITKHIDQVGSVQVILEKDHHCATLSHRGQENHTAEVILRLPGKEFFAHATADDMYKAIDLITEKMRRQLDRYKNLKKVA